MTDLPEIHVNIGEVKIASGSHILMARLGSCVGIGLLWRKKGVFGLAHCLLPDGPPENKEIGARFVSQAIPSLLVLLQIGSLELPEVTAVVTGGGNMTAPKNIDTKDLIGTLNGDRALALLAKAKIKIEHVDLGGAAGRKIYINCLTGEYNIYPIPRMDSTVA